MSLDPKLAMSYLENKKIKDETKWQRLHESTPSKMNRKAILMFVSVAVVMMKFHKMFSFFCEFSFFSCSFVKRLSLTIHIFSSELSFFKRFVD